MTSQSKGKEAEGANFIEDFPTSPASNAFCAGMDALEFLQKLAVQGDVSAAMNLVQVAHSAAVYVNQLVKWNAPLAKRVATHFSQWPVLLSTHPEDAEKVLGPRRGPKGGLLREIGLGSGLVQPPPSRKRVSKKTPANQFIEAGLMQINARRNVQLMFGKSDIPALTKESADDYFFTVWACLKRWGWLEPNVAPQLWQLGVHKAANYKSAAAGENAIRHAIKGELAKAFQRVTGFKVSTAEHSRE